MTISSSVSQFAYTGNGVTTTFSYGNKVMALTEIAVYVNGALKTYGVDYTVNGTPDTGADGYANATVFFTAAPANLSAVLLASNPSNLQPVNLPSNGPLPSSSVEGALDRITLGLQALAGKIGKFLSFSTSYTGGASTVIGDPVAGYYLRTNLAGTALEWVNIVASSVGTFLASGAGAVGRTFQAKCGDLVSVKDFGATCNGSADDTIATAALIAALAAAGGGTAFIPGGSNLRLTSTITISSSNIHIKGDGMWSTKVSRASDYGDTFKFTGNDGTGTVISNVGISDLNFVSTALTTSGAHITMNGVSRFSIHDIYIQDGFKGFQLTGASAGYINAVYCVFTNIYGGAATGRRFMSFNASAAAYSNRNCGDIFITDFNLRGNTSANVTEIGVYVATADGIWFENGHIGNCSLANTIISAETSLLNLVWFSNVMIDEGIGYGLLFQGSTSVGRNIGFSNCIIKGGGTTTHGIITSNTATFYGVSFVGCQVIENGQHGVIIDSTNFRRVDFTGCQVRGNSLSSPGTYHGYSLSANTRDVTITGGNSGGHHYDPTLAGQQGFGILIGSGSTNVLLTGVDLRGNVTSSTSGNSGQYRNCLVQDSYTIPSAATLTLPPWGDVFHVSGTTSVTNMQITWPGRTVTLIFDGALTFTDGSNLKLAGNFVTTADDAITMSYDGSNWYESGRSVN